MTAIPGSVLVDDKRPVFATAFVLKTDNFLA